MRTARALITAGSMMVMVPPLAAPEIGAEVKSTPPWLSSTETVEPSRRLPHVGRLTIST